MDYKNKHSTLKKCYLHENKLLSILKKQGTNRFNGWPFVISTRIFEALLQK